MKLSNNLVLIYCAIVQTFDFPKQIYKVCDRDDLDLDDCLKDAVQMTLKDLKNGIPEYGLVSLDPYHQKEMILEYKQNQIYGKAIMSDIVVDGLSKAKVHAVRANLQDDFMKLEVDMSNEIIKTVVEFGGEGRLNALVLKAQNAINENTMSGLTWTWKLYGVPIVKNNATYMKIKKFYMRPEVKNMRLKFKNFILGDPIFSRYAERFAQDNWKLIYNELLPVITKIWQKLGIRLSNKIFLNIPYDELFPTSE